MSTNPKRIFTQADWDAAEQLDRLHMHLLEPRRWRLNSTDEAKLEVLKIVWKILAETRSPRARRVAVVALYGCSDRQAFRLLDEARKLFVETLGLDVELEMRLAYERLLHLAEQATLVGEYEAAMKAELAAQALLEKIEARKPREARVYMPIQPTTDPRALTGALPEGEDYVEYETILEPQAEAILRG